AEWGVGQRGSIGAKGGVGHDERSQRQAIRGEAHRRAGPQNDTHPDHGELLEQHRSDGRAHPEGGDRDRDAVEGAAHGAKAALVAQHPGPLEALAEHVDASTIADQDASRGDVALLEPEVPGARRSRSRLDADHDMSLLGCAMTGVVARRWRKVEAYAVACSAAFGGAWPRTVAERKAAKKASPTPVGSSTSMGLAGMTASPSGQITRQPARPSVMTSTA